MTVHVVELGASEGYLVNPRMLDGPGTGLSSDKTSRGWPQRGEAAEGHGCWSTKVARRASKQGPLPTGIMAEENMVEVVKEARSDDRRSRKDERGGRSAAARRRRAKEASAPGSKQR